MAQLDTTNWTIYNPDSGEVLERLVGRKRDAEAWQKKRYPDMAIVKGEKVPKPKKKKGDESPED